VSSSIGDLVVSSSARVVITDSLWGYFGFVISFGGGRSCQHIDLDRDVGLGPTEIQSETLPEISLGSESGVDEKLTSEWELDVRKKATGIWEMLS